MFSQYYNITFSGEYSLNLTNVYKNLFVKNNSPYDVTVYYRKIKVFVVPSLSSILLENVFYSDTKKKAFDENIQLVFDNNNGMSSNVEIINYGV